jgi:hypothetical protein
MKEKHKAKDYYNTISKLWTDDQRICQDERKQRSHHINSSLLWISSSMNEWMNAWQILVGLLSSDDWFKPLVVFIFVVEELELWISNFFYTYLPSTLLPPLGGCSPISSLSKERTGGSVSGM